MALRFPSWSKALLGIVVVKAVLSLAVKPGSFVVSYSGISYFLLLLAATSFALRNAIKDILRSRPFWILLALGFGLWSLHQFLDLYYELGLHMEVPDSSISDPILFLHVAPFFAAIAILPYRPSPRTLRPGILGTLFVSFLLVSLYGFSVVFLRYASARTTIPGSALGFDTLYLAENLALVVALALAAFRVRPPWKHVYLHLLGASALYTLSSTLANLAIDSGGYLSGKFYGLGLTASVCWFVWTPLYGQQLAESEKRTSPTENRLGSQASGWTMLFVVLIAIPIMWELLHRDESATERTLRLVVAISAIVCVASAAYVKEYLAKRELASRVSVADDRLQLALKAGGAVAWDLDVKSGRNVRFGELQTTFGISSDRYAAATVEEFFQRVHPDDRQRVSDAVLDAKTNRIPYASEFRVIHQDGTVRWLASRGKFCYAPNGDAERMLGVSVDITERKQTEERLREYEKAVEGAEDLIAVCDREYRYLIANRKFLAMRKMTREQVVGRFLYEVLNKGVFEKVKEKVDECFQGKVVRYEMKYTYPALGERDILVSHYPIYGANGVDQIVSVTQDITERKRAEEALAGMSGKLIEAQEQERARVARELHDDINQRLALLHIDIEEIKQNPPASVADMSRLLTGIQENIAELSSSVQSISHQLHFSQLEYLGIVIAAKNFCRDFASHHKLEIDVKHDDVSRLPYDISLCLFRVLQEALHNAVKYSKVRHFEVTLGCSANYVYLTVSDHGIGFDLQSAKRTGLGLISMQERVRLVNGTINIDSKPMRGTTIHARVPFVAKSESAASAG